MSKTATQTTASADTGTNLQRDIELIEYEEKVQNADAAARSAKVKALKEGQGAKAKLDLATKEAKLKYATAFPAAEQQRADLDADVTVLRTSIEQRLDDAQRKYVKGVVADAWKARAAFRTAQKALPAAQKALTDAQKEYDEFKSLGDRVAKEVANVKALVTAAGRAAEDNPASAYQKLEEADAALKRLTKASPDVPWLTADEFKTQLDDKAIKVAGAAQAVSDATVALGQAERTDKVAALTTSTWVGWWDEDFDRGDDWIEPPKQSISGTGADTGGGRETDRGETTKSQTLKDKVLDAASTTK
ncbi:MAG: hypothetical protein AVDCRST_MAG64-1478 [uncultured Phycisphaerae bacterium]|uniref:Uncharacterized protein n=1 Tax=uncultured Phycisphaerae bacterium TaxID=904963 RepID=A0A6J4NZI8_9BACT|nr:MAG: hypothetical protein AVDCRST_MAG64-1478 [uncultured Phycisphaerae bacterium]